MISQFTNILTIIKDFWSDLLTSFNSLFTDSIFTSSITIYDIPINFGSLLVQFLTLITILLFIYLSLKLFKYLFNLVRGLFNA